MPNVKTVTPTGGEIAVTFGDSHTYYVIANMTDSEIYASGNPGIVPYADGVYTIPPGVETRISPERSGDTIYLLGSGMVQVRAETIAVPTSFKRTAKGGDGKAEPLVLFEGMTDGYNFANGITGFDIINIVPGGGNVLIQKNNNDPDFWGNTVNVELVKSFSISTNETISEYVDSALYALNQKVDLTNYNYILADCFYYSDYSSSDYLANIGGAYFRIGEPDNFPQSHVAYDWNGNGWENMYIKSNRTPITFFYDVTDISGLQKICFGVLHGTYHSSFTNILRIHKIILI